MAEHPQKTQALAWIEAALIRGEPTADIARYVVDEFRVSARWVYAWIAQSRESLATYSAAFLSGAGKKYALGKSLRRRDALYRHALDEGDYRLCLDIQRDTDRLLGIYAAEKFVVDTVDPSNGPKQYTDAELAAIASGGSLRVAPEEDGPAEDTAVRHGDNARVRNFSNSPPPSPSDRPLGGGQDAEADALLPPESWEE